MVKPTAVPTQRAVRSITGRKQHFPSVVDDNTVKAEIRRVFGQNSRVALAVAMQESGYQEGTINSVCCIGIFQVNVLPNAHFTKVPGATMSDKIIWLQDYKNNIKFAKQIFDSSNWYPWEAYTSGAYKKYLDK